MPQDPSALVTLFESELPELHVSLERETLESYGQDWTRFHDPKPSAIVFPRTVQQVVDLVQFARRHKLKIVPSGGRTGLSGGAVATDGELVVSFDKMNRIHPVNTVDQTVVCEAGVITEVLQAHARDNGLFYPVDFAAAGSSQIGGNIATNAGGINVIRYGMTRDWVVGLKVVTGTGEVLNLNQGLTKNNTGYDFRHLMIGSEGTLGLIVEATMKLTQAPTRSDVIFLAVPTTEHLMRILETFNNRLTLNAFEFLSHNALTKVIEHAGVVPPCQEEAPFYALIEVENPSADTEQIILEAFEQCFDEGWAVDGVLSRDRDQAKALWRCREQISETITRWTPYKNDVSVCVSQVPAFLVAVEAVVKNIYADLEIVWFGHIGDGNLHLNILKPNDLDVGAFKARCDEMSPQICEVVRHYGGSVSAEHGIGLLKKSYLHYTRPAAEIALMKQIKSTFDPDGVLNPGKIF